MRKFGITFLIILALFSGIGASALAYYYLQSQSANSGPELESIVVAAKDITFGEKLERKDMKIVMYPKASVPKGSYREADSLLDQVTKVFLKGNEPILDSKLSSKGGGLSLLIENNMRAISVQVDKVSGVSGFVLPGDRVDVIATVSNVRSNRNAIARTILQRVEVLAAGQKTERKGDKVATVQSVTLLVDPRGAQALALASQGGKLVLVLRNPTDNEILAVEPTSRNEILGTAKKTKTTTKAKSKTRSKPRTKKTVKKQDAATSDTLVIVRGGSKKSETPAMKDDNTNKDIKR